MQAQFSKSRKDNLMTSLLKRIALILCFFCLIVFDLTLFAPSSQAHSLFIQSGRYAVSSGRGTPLFFCFGHHFPVDDAVRREKFNFVKVVDPDKQENNVQLRDEKSLHSYVIDYEKEGTYALVAETTPGLFAMYTDKKGRERHSFKPLSTFIDNAESIKSSMLSSQWAKAYVVCDHPSVEFPGQVGLPLELVPLQDPATLKEGDRLTLQVYYEGKPYAGVGFWDATYGGYSTEAEDMYVQRTKVTGGRISVPVDASGRWFVRYYTKVDAPEEKHDQYLTEKRTTTLTFMVRNERRQPEADSE